MHPGVKYELQELEKLFSTGAESARGKGLPADVKDAIKHEVSRIKQTLVHEVFAINDERHLERYIRYHQQALIRLMDEAALFLNGDNGRDGHGRELQAVLYEGTEQLLSFVRRHFAKYFDYDAEAPKAYVDIARRDARVNLRKLQKGFSGKPADLPLVEILLSTLERITEPTRDPGITYRTVSYAKEVEKELFRLLKEEKELRDWNEELRQVTYYLDYNSTGVVAYHAHYITSLLDQSETRAEKIEKLSFVLKQVNQAQVKPGIRFDQTGMALKDQLNIYITEEIAYQERLEQLNGTGLIRSADSFLPGFKLKMDVSVSQLAYMLRILIETRVILNNNVSQILHFLVKYMITRRSETISYGSFRSKFYSVETGTKEAVKAMLVSMLNYIEKS